MVSDKLSRFPEWVVNHKKIVVIVLILLCMGSGAAAMNLHMDNSIEAYFMEDDPSWVEYREFMDEYGNDEFLYIVYTTDEGIFESNTLEKTHGLTDDLTGVPFVEKITAITTLEYLEPDTNGSLQTGRMIDRYESDGLKQAMLANPEWVNNYVSEDGRYGAIVCEVADKPEDDENYHIKIGDRLRDVLTDEKYSDFQFWPVGEPVINSEFYELLEEDIALVTSLNYFLVFALLLLFFRHVKGLFGPLVMVLIGSTIAIGFIGLMGFRLTGMFGITPSLLTTIGVATAVHVMVEYRAYVKEGLNNKEAVVNALRMVGIPVVFTCLTTAVGLASFMVSPVPAVKEFGAYSAFGVLVLMVLAFTILPVVLSVTRGKAKPIPVAVKETGNTGILNRFLGGVAELNRRWYKVLLIVIVALLGLAVFGITQIEVNSSYLEEIGSKNKIYDDYKFVDENMGGTGNFEILLNSEKDGGVRTVEFAETLGIIEQYMNSQSDLVRKTSSELDVIRGFNSALNGSDGESFVIPDSDADIDRALSEFQNLYPDDFEKLISDDETTARFSVQASYMDSKTADRFGDDLSDYLDSTLADGYSYEVTGASYLLSQSMHQIERTQITSIILALVIISVLMVIVFRSFKIGLVSMLPNVFPILIMFGIMGLAGIWLDYFRAMVTCIAIGIAVDDTIHFVARYRYEFDRLGNYAEALKATMSSVGRAVLFSSVILVTGFGMTMLSSINDTFYFGLLVCICIFVALLADLFFTPALILLIKPFGKERA